MEENETTPESYNTTFLVMNGSSNFSGPDELEIMKLKYTYSVPPMLAICTLSLVINLTVLISSFWIRRPISPTLHLSLSLAAADFYSTILWMLCLVLFSLLPVVFDVDVMEYKSCIWMTTDLLRLSSVAVIVAHLLALALNHYLGILKPLHYQQILTHRKTTIWIGFLWLVPHIFFFAYYSSVPGEAYQLDGCTEYPFLQRMKFRLIFSSLFFVPLVVMIFIYSHIFVIVRRHQAMRLRLSMRQCDPEEDQGFKKKHKQMTRNIKAVKTTLFIVGSYIVGLMPAVIVFFMICEDCPIQNTGQDQQKMFYLYLVVNILLIVKTTCNPIIYAARMKEVKKGLIEMQEDLCDGFSVLNRGHGNTFGTNNASLRAQRTSSSSFSRKNTTQCKISLSANYHETATRKSSTKSLRNGNEGMQSQNGKSSFGINECDTQL